jgi:hypothetical protein
MRIMNARTDDQSHESDRPLYLAIADSLILSFTGDITGIRVSKDGYVKAIA